MRIADTCRDEGEMSLRAWKIGAHKGDKGKPGDDPVAAR